MIYTLFIGLLIGVVAKFLMPGRDPGGFIMTILLGIGGAMLASWAGVSMGLYSSSEPASFIAAVMGSLVILFIYRSFSKSNKS